MNKPRKFKTDKKIWALAVGYNNGNWWIQLGKYVFTTEPG